MKPDLIYALLNWQAVEFAEHVLTEKPGVACGAPVAGREVFDVAEGQRSDRVEPLGVGRPEREQSVSSLLEREDALRVVGKLADEQDRESA